MNSRQYRLIDLAEFVLIVTMTTYLIRVAVPLAYQIEMHTQRYNWERGFSDTLDLAREKQRQRREAGETFNIGVRYDRSSFERLKY